MDHDIGAFRRALGQFATGVAVVTARGPSGEAIGLTMNSFSSVSLEPPLILFSLDRKARSLAAMQAAEGYAVNVLGREQQALAERFARPRPDKWQAVEHVAGIAGAPLIAGAIAHFECAPFACYDGGDHLIFVGRVVRFETFVHDEPLVFFRGEYRGIAQHGPAAAWPLPIHY